MTNKIEISRELADRLTRAYPAEITDQETMQAMRIEALAALDELRALLAAPAVERQEPVGHVSYIGSGFVRVRTTECLAMEQPLYTSPPAPVAVVLPEKLGIERKVNNVNFNHGWNACLDKVKEMNR